MLDNIKNLLKSDEINLKFADLTAVGSPKDSFHLSSGLDNAALHIPGGPDKVNFYSTLDQNMPTVMSIYKKEKRRLEKIDALEDAIVKELKKEEKDFKTPSTDKNEAFRKKLQKTLKSLTGTQDLEVKSTGGAVVEEQTGGNLKNYINKLRGQENVTNDPLDNPESPITYNIVDTSNPASEQTKETALLKDIVDEYEDDPVLSPKYIAIGSVDRVIFIIGTYFIRAIVLFMIEWAINSHMITTFQQCFKAYVVGYISLFLIWVLIANAVENQYEENVLLSSLFYYINVNAHSASKFRIGIHIFVQIILLPLLFIIKYKASPVDQDSFEQRRAIYNATSNFTFFIWTMTSIIATRF
jgi:hypothetical protein